MYNQPFGNNQNNQSVIPNQNFDLSNQCLIKPFKFSATSKKGVDDEKR